MKQQKYWNNGINKDGRILNEKKSLLSDYNTQNLNILWKIKFHKIINLTFLTLNPF